MTSTTKLRAEDLKPGPEMDALVAEKVLGYAICYPAAIASHSTSDAAALDVLRAFTEEDEMPIQISIINYPPVTYIVTIGAWGKEATEVSKISLGYAVCIAALKAKGVVE